MNDNIIEELISKEEKTKLKKVRKLLEEIIENIDFLLDDELLKDIQEAEEDIKKGRVKRWAKLEKELGLSEER